MHVDEVDVLLDAATDNFAGRVGGQVDRREDRGPQHVAQTLPDRLEQVGLIGEVAVDLWLRGPGLFGDFPHTQLGPQAVDCAECRLDNFAAHLLAMFAPAFAARVDLHSRGRGGMGSGNSPHVKYLTAVQP